VVVVVVVVVAAVQLLHSRKPTTRRPDKGRLPQTNSSFEPPTLSSGYRVVFLILPRGVPRAERCPGHIRQCRVENWEIQAFPG